MTMTIVRGLLIGKCGTCGTVRREWAGPFREVERWCGNCTTTVVRLRPVRAVVSDKRCDARCTSASGRECSCECGGRNHGKAHDWKAAVDV